MTKNEAIWDATDPWNGAERRGSSRERVERDNESYVTIQSLRAAEISGVIVDFNESGMGIAVSAKEPIFLDDNLIVQHGRRTYSGIVRHITDGEVVVVGIEWR